MMADNDATFITREDRSDHSVVVMSFGTFILGGKGNSGNSEYLKKYSNGWKLGPTIPSPGLAFGCALPIDTFRFVVIGGYPDGSSDPVGNVRVYDMASGSWTEWQPLNTPAFFVACARDGNKIVVGGGYRHNPSGKSRVGHDTLFYIFYRRSLRNIYN